MGEGAGGRPCARDMHRLDACSAPPGLAKGDAGFVSALSRVRSDLNTP